MSKLEHNHKTGRYEGVTGNGKYHVSVDADEFSEAGGGDADAWYEAWTGGNEAVLVHDRSIGNEKAERPYEGLSQQELANLTKVKRQHLWFRKPGE